MWRLAARAASAVGSRPLSAVGPRAFTRPPMVTTPLATVGFYSGSRSLFTSWEDKPIASNDLSVTEIVNKEIEDRNTKASIGRDMFGIIHFSGKQMKVSPGDLVVVDNMAADIGSRIYLNKVLMVGSREFTVAGAPLLDKDFVKIEALVVEKTRSRREIVYKFKKRKRYRKKTHHRHIRVLLRIESIGLSPNLVGTDGISGEPLRPPGVNHGTPPPRSSRLRASLNTTQRLGREFVPNEFDHDLTNDDDLLPKGETREE